MMEEKKTTKLWEDYQSSLQYQGSIGLRDKLARCVRFFEGDQWPAVTEDTASLPRPVVNVTAMIARNKKASILSSPVRLVYRADTAQPMQEDTGALLLPQGSDGAAGAEMFTRFADYIQKEYGQNALDKDGMHDGVIKGTHVYHYYWDADATGLDGSVEGALRCEIIDATNIHVANPTQRDEQKQEWIMISSRENVDTVRAMVKDENDRARIGAQKERHSAYNTKEPDTDRLCTVLTRYFRRDGEVYFERGTEEVVITPPTPLAPDIEAAARSLGISLDDEEAPKGTDGGGMDAPNATMPDDVGVTAHEREREQPRRRPRAPLYPVVIASYEKREGSIYGIGEVERLIPNQKVINNLLAMIVYNVQQMAWNKWIVLETAMKQGETITNEPGEIIVDHSNTGRGIQSSPPPQMSGMPMELLDVIVNLTRNVSGASEVMTGETLGANMSGAAIAQLQAQAQQPIEELRDTFWEVKKKQGRVLAQFFKLFYHQRPFVWEEEDGEERGLHLGIFEGDAYAEVEFEVVVEVMGGTKYSAAGDINVLDTLLASGQITLETYIEAYPDDALSNKSKLLAGIRKEKESRAAALSQQLESLQSQLTEALEVIQKQREMADNSAAVIAENKRLKLQLQQQYVETETLRAEATEKIRAANAEIEAGNARLAEVTADASQFAQALAGV